MPTEIEDKTKVYVLSTLNSLPYALSMGEIKEVVARVSKATGTVYGNYAPHLIEQVVHDLVMEGKIVVRDHDIGGWREYIARRHIPRFRTLDCDWQW